MDELRTPTGSIIPHLLLSTIQIITLITPPFTYRRHTFGTALVLIFLLSRIRPHFSNNMAIVQPFVLGVSTYLSVLEKVIFSDSRGPEYHFWRVDQPAHEALCFAAFGFRKLRWALSMQFNMRGIRWNYEVKNVPLMQKKSKTDYLSKQLIGLLYYFIMGDAVSQLWVYIFFENESNATTLRHMSLIWSFVGTLAFGLMPYYVIQIQYVASAIIAVGLGISQPEDWPPYFGKISDVSTVRDFWGKYWHQTLRRPLLAFTQAFVSGIGVKRGTPTSSYIQLWLAFLISGIIHAQSLLMMPCPVQVSIEWQIRGVMSFFLFQAAAITIEDFFQWFAQKLGYKPGWITKIIGYCWVASTLWFSLPFIGDVLLHMRFGKDPLLNSSPARAFIRKLPRDSFYK
ncbi:hypothetical protein CC78DRAFT_462229 [Lojkania enalia]|uniref:Wax synthase domain-containing protein n=1 Tax=Lojkania enalia TaxID=147567 RepID=A0A9P4N0R2_9PLEO|nr:hypothetical protein CC78DRAFT_462229 [Didymosphaeria enalia]